MVATISRNLAELRAQSFEIKSTSSSVSLFRSASLPRRFVEDEPIIRVCICHISSSSVHVNDIQKHMNSPNWINFNIEVSCYVIWSCICMPLKGGNRTTKSKRNDCRKEILLVRNSCGTECFDPFSQLLSRDFLFLDSSFVWSSRSIIKQRSGMCRQ